MLHAPLVQLLDAGLEWKWCCLRRRLNFMSDVFVSSCDLFSSAWQHQPHQTATPPVFRLEAPPQTPETQQTLPGAQHIDLANLQISAQRPTAAASAPAAQPTEPRPATKDGVPLTHKTAANTYLVPMPAHYACVVGAMRDWAAPASEGTRQATADGSSDEALQQLLNDVRVPLSVWELNHIEQRLGRLSSSHAALKQRAKVPPATHIGTKTKQTCGHCRSM